MENFLGAVASVGRALRAESLLDLCLESQQPLALTASSVKHRGTARVGRSMRSSNPLRGARLQPCGEGCNPYEGLLSQALALLLDRFQGVKS